MFSRKPVAAILAALGIVLAAHASTGAATGMDAKHTMYLTFNRPVSLPGVSLGAGTYIFEIPDAYGHHSLVRVTSTDHSTVYFTAFTSVVDRPFGMKPDRVISFGEASSDRPSPILVWWPQDDSAGREFIYAKK